MSKQVYLVCEKDVAGGINRQQFSQVLQEQEIEHEILPVSNRAVIDRPAISKELFSRIAWLCFSTPDAVRLFFAFFHDLHINLSSHNHRRRLFYRVCYRRIPWR